MITEFCSKDSRWVWNCEENVTLIVIIISVIVAIFWIIGTIALFSSGRKDLTSKDIEERKSGLVDMVLSPVWPIAVIVYLISDLYQSVVNLFRDIRNLQLDIREEKEAEKTRILERAMVELEEMKREEHEDWMRKFNSIGTKE